MYQRILVPIDGSATASRGLDEAIRVAKLTNGQIRLLHVIEPPVAFSPEVNAFAIADLIESIQQAGQDILRDARARVTAAGIAVDTHLGDEVGTTVADQVCRQVEQWKADLIVLGTHGRRGLKRLVIGSDAEEVLRRASVPVLMVHLEESADAQT
jgi:nucleotide-binding universal stress UspA family protein